MRNLFLIFNRIFADFQNWLYIVINISFIFNNKNNKIINIFLKALCAKLTYAHELTKNPIN